MRFLYQMITNYTKNLKSADKFKSVSKINVHIV